MAEKTGKIDRAEICLREWIERAHGYHNSDVWQQWKLDTAAALEQHKADRAQLAERVKDAQWALLDHNVLMVASYLNELGELLK